MLPNFQPLLQKLIACRSVSGNRVELERCLGLLEREFLPYFYVRRYQDRSCPLLVFSTAREKKLDLIMAGHIDVVPAPVVEFNLRARHGKYFGRGVYDMKGPLLASLYALRDWSMATAKNKAVAVVVNCDEETGGHSLQSWLARRGYTAKFALLPDGGGENEIVVRQKGLLQLCVNVSGRSTHASSPHEGENPIERVFDLYHYLHHHFPQPKHQSDWRTSVALTRLHAGEAVNQVPDSAEAYFDIRYANEQDKRRVLSAVRRYLGRRAEVRTFCQARPFLVSRHNNYVKKLSSVIKQTTGQRAVFVSEAATSDAVAFTGVGIPATLFCPEGGGAHEQGEWVNIKSLTRFYKIIRNFLEII